MLILELTCILVGLFYELIKWLFCDDIGLNCVLILEGSRRVCVCLCWLFCCCFNDGFMGCFDGLIDIIFGDLNDGFLGCFEGWMMAGFLGF